MARRRVNVRPGKGQSKLGFAVGIIFCLIGLVIVIPTFGLFGLFWTAIAAVITVQNYRNAFTDEGSPTHVIEVEEEDLAGMGYAPDTRQPADDAADRTKARLDAARRLYDEGAITREEYDRKREEILAQL